MDDITQMAARPTSILDLPKEILLDIFGCFHSKFPTHDPSVYRKPQPTQAKNRLNFLGTNRLVCRAFNELISPLLCPVVSVSLSSESMDRLEGLSRNPLIAQGIRGIAISLLFRPHAIATDFRRYHAYAETFILRLESECDYYTEFEEYDQADASEEAVDWRKYHVAWAKLSALRSAWRGMMDDESSSQYGPQQTGIAGEDDEAGLEASADGDGQTAAEACAMLRICFERYALAHVHEDRIISDGSFIRSVVRARSRCGTCDFVWFNEDQLGRERFEKEAVTLAADESALIQALTQGHEWLRIESYLCKTDGVAGLFFPASLLIELPIACHNVKRYLEGILVSCFPLLRGYRCLLPATDSVEDTANSNPWARFAAACVGLEFFEFGRRGMNCLPLRSARQSASDLKIIDGFIGAAISGPHLQHLDVNMYAFQARQGKPETKLLYPSSSILTAIRTTRLRKVLLSDIDVCEQSLVTLIKKASAGHIGDFCLGGITLSSGRYATAMGLLHEIMISRKYYNASTPSIRLIDLWGAEFGDPSTVNKATIYDTNWLWESDGERDTVRDRPEERFYIDLKQIEQWVVKGCANETNPLLEWLP